MLKRILPAIVGASLLMAVAGCTDPIAAEQDPLREYPQVHLESYDLQYDIRVQTPIATRVGAGQLQVDIPIRNRSEWDLELDYKYYFTDAKGLPIENDTSWHAVRIPRKGIETIEFKSLTASAADFRVELRRKKFE